MKSSKNTKEQECKTHGKTIFILEGRGYYRCRQCRMDRVAAQRRKNKEVLVKEHGGKCKICGYDKHIGALQFHHINPDEKNFGIAAKGRTYGIAKLREEAKKCILVCSNCHAEIEHNNISIPG